MKGNILISLLIVLFLGVSAYLLGTATIAKATSPTHKQWSITQWTDWSECQPVAECGTDEGTQLRKSYRVCSFHPGGRADCRLGDILWLQTQERSCEVETPACVVDVCENLEGVQEDTPEGYVNDKGFCYVPEDEDGEDGEEVVETPQPPGPIGWSPSFTPEPYHEETCNGVLPTAAVAIGGSRVDSDTVLLTWYPSLDGGIDHQILQYGYSQDNLEYGVPSLPSDSGGLEVNGVGSGHVWFRVGVERDTCLVWSNVTDP